MIMAKWSKQNNVEISSTYPQWRIIIKYSAILIPTAFESLHEYFVSSVFHVGTI